MRFDDERRPVPPVQAARRAHYLSNLDKLIADFEGLQLRDAARSARLQAVTKELSTAQSQVQRLTKETVSLRKERDSLRNSLAALRGSWRYRLGTAATAPARSAGRVRASLAASAKAILRASGESDLPAGTPVISKVTTSDPQVLDAVEAGRRRKEELLAVVAVDSSKASVYKLIAHSYFVLGEVSAPAALVDEYAHVLVDLSRKEIQLLNAIAGQAALLVQPIALPPRQHNPGYQVERGRIMYCAHSVSPYNSNGYSTRTAGLVRGLVNAGADLVVAARPGYPWDVATDRAPSSLDSYKESIDGIVHYFSNGPSWTQSRLDHYLQEAADHYVQLAIRNRVERIHAASNHVTALPALIAARRLGLPFTYEVRGLWEITESSTKPGWEDSDRFKLARMLETLVASEADTVLAITPQVRDELVDRGVPSGRISILPNAVDTDEFTEMPPHAPTLAELGIQPGGVVIGYAGSLVEYEGLETLLSAARLLLDGGTATTTVIVGDGPALPQLRATAARLELSDAVIFTGRVPSADIPRYVSVFDIMPCPRLPLPVTEMVPPLKPLEAMAAAKAVVLSDLPPLRDLAGADGERARLFKAGSSEQLARVIEDLAGNAKQRRVMGRRARLWALQERTWDKVGATALSSISKRPADPVTGGLHLNKLTLGIIADEFTRTGLGPDINLLVLHPTKWLDQLRSTPINALFVESAWEGNDGLWQGKVGYYDDESFAELSALVDYCREQSVPTVFWNKEDPVHTNRFIRTAQEFDHVFTSDDGSIPVYLKTAGSYLKSVASLPFYAQPALHNPIGGVREYSHTVCYAGSYYGDRYKKRSGQLSRLLTAALPSGLTIYDRQHSNPDSPYHFPASLSRYVRGGLTYPEMIEAYKFHPVHINVNSVGSSGTMFSRRVFEIAASGNAVVSGPGRGVEQLFDGAVPVVADEAGARALIDYWMTDESARVADAWVATRAVLRSHTAAHRLTYMLRTAGLKVEAPEPEEYAVVVQDFTPDVLEQLNNQSVRPSVVLVEKGFEKTLEDLRTRTAFRVEIHTPEAVVRLAEAGISLVGHLRKGGVDRTFYEDLLHSRQYSRWSAVRYSEEAIETPGKGLARQDDSADDSFPPDLIDLGAAPASPRVVLQRDIVVDKAEAHASALMAVQTPLTVLVAGHDLKFAGGIVAELESRGHRVLLDQWQGHSHHDEEESLRKLDQADVVFCEWTLGNAVWFARNKRPNQRLVCRVHLQEIHTPYLGKLDMRAVDQFIFVGQHIADIAQRDFAVPQNKALVIPNYVDVDGLRRRKSADARWNLGFVGMVPQRKRFDLALDVLRDLRAQDNRYSLFVKGKTPEDYPWMSGRADELAYYEAQNRRIEEDPLLAGAVIFDPQGSDMPSWYSKIGTVLSVSDFESFHLTVADGAASGALPASLAWAGADRIYPGEWLHADTSSLAARVFEVTSSPTLWAKSGEEAHYVAKDRFDSTTVLAKIVSVITGR